MHGPATANAVPVLQAGPEFLHLLWALAITLRSLAGAAYCVLVLAPTTMQLVACNELAAMLFYNCWFAAPLGLARLIVLAIGRRCKHALLASHAIHLPS